MKNRIHKQRQIFCRCFVRMLADIDLSHAAATRRKDSLSQDSESSFVFISTDIFILVDSLHGIFIDARLDQAREYGHLLERLLAFGINRSGNKAGF